MQRSVRQLRRMTLPGTPPCRACPRSFRLERGPSRSVSSLCDPKEFIETRNMDGRKHTTPVDAFSHQTFISPKKMATAVAPGKHTQTRTHARHTLSASHPIIATHRVGAQRHAEVEIVARTRPENTWHKLNTRTHHRRKRRVRPASPSYRSLTEVSTGDIRAHRQPVSVTAPSLLARTPTSKNSPHKHISVPNHSRGTPPHAR